MGKKGRTRAKSANRDVNLPLIASLDRALNAKDSVGAVAALDELIARYPAWMRLIARLDALSDTASPKTNHAAVIERCIVLLKAAHSLARSNPIPRRDLQWLETLVLITSRSAASFARLRELLKSFTFFSDSLSTQTFRLAVFLENQSRQANRLAAEHGTVRGTYNPYAALDHFLTSPTGGKTSIVDNYEQLVEAIELVLRYSHYSVSPELRSAPLVPKDPFLDPDIERTIIAANIWTELNDILSAVKYGGWRSHRFSFDHACYAPSDEAEYMRFRVGDIREQAILAQFFAEASDSASLYKRGQMLIRLSREVEYPPPGQTWNGKYPSALGALIKADKTFVYRAQSWIAFRHYKPFARSLLIDDRRTGWEAWLAARGALNALATLFSHSLKLPGQEDDDDDWRHYIVVARKSDLVNVAQEAGITKREAEAAIDSMVFDQRRRFLELWDQPLLPLAGGCVLVIPSLIQAANPTRVLENAIAQWTPKSATARGLPFEGDILADVRALGYGTVQKNVKLTDDHKKPVQYDLIWWWGEHLFLIETKCLQSVHGFADHARAKEDIENGFEQLRRRRHVARINWDQLRRAAPELHLPAKCPPDSSITGIVLTNLTCFTTWVTIDGLVVTDDICFRRYFGDPNIDVYSQSGIGEQFIATIGRIRTSAPSPLNLISYLHDPPQCQTVRKRLKATMVETTASETEFPTWRMNVDYHPDLEEWLLQVK